MRLEYSAQFDPGQAAEFENFPASPAVFALFPANESSSLTQPYLSHARDLRRRLQRLLGTVSLHSRRLNLREVTRRIEYQPVGSNFEAQWLLLRLSQRYDPETFRRRLRIKPPALVKLKLRNRFPRCYATTRLISDGSLYYGPFPSRAAAERFTGVFLDLFKIRRCLPNLNPDPSHPGCIYSQMKMCLAPCFKGCTDEEYQTETARVIAFLDSAGESLERELEGEREAASAKLEFERAAHAHHKLGKMSDALRLISPLVRSLQSLHAIMLFPGAGPKTVAFFRLVAGEIRGPALLVLGDNVSSPAPLDQRIQELLSSLARDLAPPSASTGPAVARPLPPWEHLSLLARWYYSSFRSGEILMLPPQQEIAHSKLIKLVRKVVNEQA